jgi:hypothetical protein
MISVLAIGPKVRGFKLGRGRWIFIVIVVIIIIIIYKV